MTIANSTRQAALRTVLVSLFFLVACSNVAVNTELAPSADFAGRKTYAWAPNPQNGYFLWRGIAQGIVDPQGGGSGQGQNIQSAVQQMFAKFPN